MGPEPIDASERTSVAVALSGLADALRLALDRQGLSLAQHRVLAILANGPVMATTLAGQLGITSASVTAMIDRLVEAGLVERLADPRDRRRVIHRIDDRGRSVLAAADEAVVDLLGTVLAAVPTHEGEALLEALPRWGAAIRRRLLEVFEEHARSGEAVGFAHIFASGDP